MNSQTKKYLHDIITSIENIDVHFQGKKMFETYHKNITIKRAVERELEIIGEGYQ